MYARSTTLRGNPEAMDQEIAYVRNEVMPALMGMSGCVGLSMLADRSSGRCIITSAWADDTSMHATEQAADELRRRAAEIMRGDYDAQSWEIAVLHRAHEAHDGCCTRVVWGEVDPSRMEDNAGTFRMAMLPRLDELPGFCSISVMADRDTGRTAVATTYDSREDMQRATEMAAGMREEFASALGVRTTDVAEFDLVLHHLRVPETV